MNDMEMVTAEDVEKIFGSYGTDDYLMSDEPYLVLLKATNGLNAVRRHGVISMVKNMAKKAGCSNQDFNSMLREARKMSSEPMPNGTGFPGIEELLNGNEPVYGDYICSEEGIFLYDKKAQSCITVCPHPVFLTRRYVNMDTNAEMVDVSFYRDDEWKTRRMIPFKTIIEPNQITSLGSVGLGITSENARYMIQYFSDIYENNRDIIPAVETTGRMGWLDDRGFVPYVPDIIYDDRSNYQEMFTAIHKEGSMEEWVKLARAVRANKDNPAGKIVLAASVASVILPWTCNQSFMVHLWSPMSGTGKTLALMLAASVWADPTMGKYLKPLNSTDTALEQMQNFCNNLPLCLDELESVQGKDTNATIYRLSEGMGKNRATKNLGIREQTHWMNIIITNGEHPLTDDSKGGSINRVISVESTGLLFPGGDQGLSDAAEIMLNHYGHAGEKIISVICSRPEWIKLIQGMYQNYKNILLGKATGKQASYGAALIVGDWLLGTIVTRDDNQITIDEIMNVLATPDMTDMNMRAQRIVCDFVAVNLSGFVHEDDPAEFVQRGRIFGKMMKDGRVYVFQTALQDTLTKANVNFTAFMRWCQQRKMIHTSYVKGKEWHWGVTVRLQGMNNNVRAICFMPEFFKIVDRESQMTIVETDADNPFSA